MIYSSFQMGFESELIDNEYLFIEDYYITFKLGTSNIDLEFKIREKDFDRFKKEFKENEREIKKIKMKRTLDEKGIIILHMCKNDFKVFLKNLKKEENILNNQQLYLFFDGSTDMWFAIDNSNGNVYLEEFKVRGDAVKWLKTNKI